ncbi:MAG: DNA translocase FtsK 4TM domain-containing protein, partial [Clostridiales Family XIII bacterium]|nr:DNA translocase FtsK 4TM domain-containing protein [Clostridiales Family XIII bacterium]
MKKEQGMAAAQKKTGGKGTRSKSSASGTRGTRSSAKADETAKKMRLREEILAIICVAVALFLFFALFISAAGKLGVFFSLVFKGLFGNIAYVIPFVLILYGILLFARRTMFRGLRSGILVIAVFLMLTIICSGFYLESGSEPLAGASFGDVFNQSADGDSGGIFGMYIGWVLVTLIGKPGLFIFSFVVLIISLLLLINTPLSP